MKQKYEKEDKIIDDYYKETPVKLKIDSDEQFKIKLEKSLEKMNALEGLDFPMDINVLEIIAKAETIKDKKNLKLESLSFIFLCIIIISSIVLLALNIGIKPVIYVEVIISVFLPLTLIPIAKGVKARGDI